MIASELRSRIEVRSSLGRRPRLVTEAHPMKPSVTVASFGLPFLVTLIGVGLVGLLGSCGDATTCAVKSFVVGPIIVIAIPITGFIAGRVSSSSRIGLVAVLAAVALVVA